MRSDGWGWLCLAVLGVLAGVCAGWQDGTRTQACADRRLRPGEQPVPVAFFAPRDPCEAPRGR